MDERIRVFVFEHGIDPRDAEFSKTGFVSEAVAQEFSEIDIDAAESAPPELSTPCQPTSRKCSARWKPGFSATPSAGGGSSSSAASTRTSGWLRRQARSSAQV